MRWHQKISEDDVFCEELIDTNGAVVGHVQRFFDDGPTYAWALSNRLGAFETIGTAKLAVQHRAPALMTR